MTDRLMTGTAYLQVRKDWGSTCRVVRATQNSPSVLADGCIVVKVRISVPAKAWEPLTIELPVEVPAEKVVRPTLEVEDADG